MFDNPFKRIMKNNVGRCNASSHTSKMGKRICYTVEQEGSYLMYCDKRFYWKAALVLEKANRYRRRMERVSDGKLLAAVPVSVNMTGNWSSIALRVETVNQRLFQFQEAAGGTMKHGFKVHLPPQSRIIEWSDGHPREVAAAIMDKVLSEGVAMFQVPFYRARSAVIAVLIAQELLQQAEDSGFGEDGELTFAWRLVNEEEEQEAAEPLAPRQMGWSHLSVEERLRAHRQRMQEAKAAQEAKIAQQKADGTAKDAQMLFSVAIRPRSALDVL